MYQPLIRYNGCVTERMQNLRESRRAIRDRIDAQAGERGWSRFGVLAYFHPDGGLMIFEEKSGQLLLRQQQAMNPFVSDTLEGPDVSDTYEEPDVSDTEDLGLEVEDVSDTPKPRSFAEEFGGS